MEESEPGWRPPPAAGKHRQRLPVEHAAAGLRSWLPCSFRMVCAILKHYSNICTAQACFPDAWPRREIARLLTAAHCARFAGASPMAASKSATVALAAGDHAVTVEWMHVDGPSKLQLLWRTAVALAYQAPRLLVAGGSQAASQPPPSPSPKPPSPSPKPPSPSPPVSQPPPSPSPPPNPSPPSPQPPPSPKPPSPAPPATSPPPPVTSPPPPATSPPPPASSPPPPAAVPSPPPPVATTGTASNPHIISSMPFTSTSLTVRFAALASAAGLAAVPVSGPHLPPCLAQPRSAQQQLECMASMANCLWTHWPVRR